MLCSKLATRGDGFQFPCGQCLNCKINKRRDWQARLLLEAASHDYGIFVTFTYNNDFGPPPPLLKSHAKFLLASLHIYYPYLRYYLVGEYGGKGGRTHFHAHLFSQIPVLDSVLRKVWIFGSIHVGDTEPASLDYVLGYLLKGSKLIRWPIEHRFPEFRITSKGMGKLALPHLLIDGTELPREFKVFGRTWPVGRYLRDRAKKMGFSVSDTKEKQLEKYEAQTMRALLKNPHASKEDIDAIYKKFVDDKKLKSKILQKKAIRAAYMQEHGYSKMRIKDNETF